MTKRPSEVAGKLKPSARDELEITDLNTRYLKPRRTRGSDFGRGTACLDTATPSALLQASLFIETIEQRQGLKIASPEEVAFRMAYIAREQLRGLGRDLSSSSHGEYLSQIADDEAVRPTGR